MNTPGEQITRCLGTWTLTAFGLIDNEQAPDRGMASQWCVGVPARVPEQRPAAGLTLTIAEDATFTETSGEGAELLDFFTDDGVLDTAASAFDGSLLSVDGRVFLRATEAEPSGTARLDDGDVEIADELIRDGGDLLRVASVVVDGMYLYRYAYRYAPA